MARSFVSGLFTAVAREAIRAARTAAREAERQSKTQYLAGRAQEAEAKTQQSCAQVTDLQNILASSFKIDYTSFFESLIDSNEFREFVLPHELKSEIEPPVLNSYLAQVKEPSFLAKLIPGSRRAHQEELEGADKRYTEAIAEHQARLRDRAERLREIQEQYECEKRAFQDKRSQRNQAVQDLRDNLS